MTNHTDLIARLRDFDEKPHANRCPADMACTCGHEVSRIALAQDVATALEALARENEALREVLAECAADLAGEIDHRYHAPDVHPAMKRKYDADMSVVVQARAALAPPHGGEGG